MNRMSEAQARLLSLAKRDDGIYTESGALKDVRFNGLRQPAQATVEICMERGWLTDEGRLTNSGRAELDARFRPYTIQLRSGRALSIGYQEREVTHAVQEFIDHLDRLPDLLSNFQEVAHIELENLREAVVNYRTFLSRIDEFPDDPLRISSRDAAADLGREILRARWDLIETILDSKPWAAHKAQAAMTSRPFDMAEPRTRK